MDADRILKRELEFFFSLVLAKPAIPVSQALPIGCGPLKFGRFKFQRETWRARKTDKSEYRNKSKLEVNDCDKRGFYCFLDIKFSEL